MKKIGLALCLSLLGFAPAQSQQFTMPPPVGVSLGACVYNLTPPTLTPTASPGMLQCDNTGNLRVTGTVTATIDTTGLATSAKQDTQTTALQPATNLATAQVSVTTGNISVAATRALRRAVTITNVTGTSAIYCGNTGVAITTGTYLGATAGSNIVLNTAAAVFCTVASVTQTVTVAETY